MLIDSKTGVEQKEPGPDTLVSDLTDLLLSYFPTGE